MDPDDRLNFDLAELIGALKYEPELNISSHTAKKLVTMMPLVADPFYASCEQNKLTVAEALELVEQKVWHYKQAAVILNALRNDMSSHLNGDMSAAFDRIRHTHCFANI